MHPTVKQFIYGTKSNTPDYMMMNGKEYRIISNQVGTPRYVIDSSSGQVVEFENMDEFGYFDIAFGSSYIPFGFAGGIYDSDTGLVRFGARDYDPETGRWVSKDPMSFAGGSANLYSYTINDPINFIDINGKSWSDVNFGNVIGGIFLVGGGLSLIAGSGGAYIVPPLAIVGIGAGGIAVLEGAGLLGIEFNNLINGKYPLQTKQPIVPNINKCDLH